jgi:hypothetical protein
MNKLYQSTKNLREYAKNLEIENEEPITQSEIEKL